jgi:hypothetical protein
MKCREVRGALAGLLDGEVMPSERTLLETHLARCDECAQELTVLRSTRSLVTGALENMGARAVPSPAAWDTLQARLAADARVLPGFFARLSGRSAPNEPPAANSPRKGVRSMRLRWKIMFGTVSAIVLAAAVIAGVPSTRAAAGEFFAGVFHISADKPIKLTYLPQGFHAGPSYVVGSVTASAQPAGSEGEQTQSVTQMQQEAFYQSGSQFILVRSTTGTSPATPEGRAAAVNGRPAVLQTGLSGTVGGPPAPTDTQGKTLTDTRGRLAQTVQEGGQTENGAETTPETVIVEAGDVQFGTESAGQKTENAGEGPATIPSITYEDASSLTWIVDGTRVEVLSNLPLAELQKVAEGLVLTQ